MRTALWLLSLLIFCMSLVGYPIAGNADGGEPIPEVEPLGAPLPGGSPQAFIQALRQKAHPYLYFEAGDLDALRAKRSQEPYASFYRSIKNWADDSVRIGIRKSGEGPTSSWITDRAVRTGLVFLIEGDQEYLDTVDEFIASLTQSEINDILADHQSVHTVLYHYAILYDLVATDLKSSTRAKLEQLLEDMVERYIEDFDDWNYRSNYPALAPHYRFPTNHGTQGESGVCLAAMAMPQHSDAPAWMDRCTRMLTFLFSTIAGDEGIWVEGPSYFDYGIDPFYDFSLAYCHLTDINVYALQDPPLQQLFQAMIKIRRPDGHGPQYGDSTLQFTNQTTIAWLLPNPAYHMWSQEIFKPREPRGTEPGSTKSGVMDFLFYQPIEPQAPPWGHTFYFAEDQVAVFRRDFSEDSSYAFVRGFDLPYSNHEHQDQGSFQFYADRTPLIVDGGYSGWQNSRNQDLTALFYPDGHNLVLVDGTGPRKDVHRENDFFVLERYVSTPFLDTTDIVGDYDHTGISYKGFKSDCVDSITGVACDADRSPDEVTHVNVRRTFYYVKGMGAQKDREYLVVIDEVYSTASPSQTHEYTLLLHGPTTQFQRQGDTYAWTTSNDLDQRVTLTGMTVANHPLTYTTRLWYHFTPEDYNRIDHTRLALSITDTTRAVFLTVLFPSTEDVPNPTLTDISDSSALGVEVQFGIHTDRLIVNPSAGTVSLGGVQTDAWSAFTRYQDNDLKIAALKQGTILRVEGQDLITESKPLGYAVGEISPEGDFELIAVSGDESTFADVPFNHPYREAIEALYQAGYTAGCSTDPLMYCPDDTMIRAESAVFVERGVHGADFEPDQLAASSFADVPGGYWGEGWIEGLLADGYTAGCGTNPLSYCPLAEHTRAEGCVFYLRMMHGPDYQPPEPQGIFVDVPGDWWGAGWVEAAVEEGLIGPCQITPELRFCPQEPLSRGLAASMMVRAKQLTLP